MYFSSSAGLQGQSLLLSFSCQTNLMMRRKFLAYIKHFTYAQLNRGVYDIVSAYKKRRYLSAQPYGKIPPFSYQNDVILLSVSLLKRLTLSFLDTYAFGAVEAMSSSL